MPCGSQNCPLPHPFALISSGWARKGAFLSGSLPALSPTPVSPCIVQDVCLEKLLRTTCPMGSAWACLPCGLELLLCWPSVLVAFGLGHEPPCLVSRPQPPWWDDPAGDVSKTRPCGNSDCMWFGPHFPGWGPAHSFSPQAGEAAAVSSLPHGHSSWPNLSFLLCSWSFLWPRQPSCSQDSCGASPHLKPVNPGTSLRGHGLSQSRGCLSRSCRDNTGGWHILCPSLSCSGTLVGPKETVTQSMPFPAHSKTAPT